MEEERLIAGEMQSEDMEIETSLRPRSLREYFGQQKVKDSLCIYMQRGAIARHDPLDHILLYGPPGLGKTTPGRHYRCGNGAEHPHHLRPGH